MNFLPIFVISLILLVITILLVIAEKFLVNYGECKIIIHKEDEQKEFVVQGGGYLLQSLVDNGISVNSSCGGKATCGYCKVRVLSGGGQLLPTEEIFMSREERLNNTRLACQVKIKNDVDVYIPDFLTTIKSIVKNEMFDPKLRWKWIRTDIKDAIPEMLTNRIDLANEDEIKVHKIIEKYAETRGAVVPILQEINNTFNYLSEPVLRYTSGKLNIPLGSMLRIATFYNAFSLKPRGKYLIAVCLGTACHVKGSGDVLSVFERELGIKTGETTDDMLFTIDAVRCIGCCGLAPVVKINEDVHGLMTKKKVPELIESYRGA